MTPLVLSGLAVAGAIGAPARYLVDGLVQDRSEGAFPWGTFTVNVSGSFLLGLIVGAALYHGFPDTPTIWLGSGFCGAYTTFSTFTFEAIRLIEAGSRSNALRYTLVSLGAGSLAAATGLALAAL